MPYTSAGEGTEPFQGTLTQYFIIVAFTSVCFYNVGLIQILIFDTFRRWKGTYFWSMIVAAWGTFLHDFIGMCKFFEIVTSGTAFSVVMTFGWYMMVTGQAIVLWSRLHLVVTNNDKLIRAVFIMICVNVVILHFPTTVLTVGSNSNKSELFTEPYNIMEKIQMTGFLIQETIISGIYLYYLLQMSKRDSSARGRTLFRHAMIVNIIVIVLDIACVSVEWANQYVIQVAFKGFVYSVKLLAEFVILNRIRAYVKANPGRQTTLQQGNGTPVVFAVKNSATQTIGGSRRYPSNNAFGSKEQRVNDPADAHEMAISRFDKEDYMKDDFLVNPIPESGETV